MYTHSTKPAEARLQSNLNMLRSSLQKVYPAKNDNQFRDLLRRLDMASTG